MALEKIKPFIVDGTQDFVFGNATITGNITSNNANLGNLAVANFFSGTLTTGSQPNITSVGTLGNLSVTSNISAGNIKTNNLLYANGSPWIMGGGGANVSGSNTQVQFNDASTFGSSTNFTFDKSTNTLTVTNLVTNGSGITNITGSSVTGQVPNALIAATVYTNSQPNITSLGTLTSLTVTGNITGGNADLGNTATANYFVGSGNNLSNIQGSNVTGAVSFASTANSVAGANIIGAVTYAATANAVAGANVMGQVGNALVAGTVYTNAQPNITSVGTLTSLTVTGNVTGNYFIGNGSQLTGITAGDANYANFAGTIVNASQPNITSVGTLSNLSVSGDIVGANLTLSGNLTVSGTTTTVNSTVTRVVDPIFELGGGANGASLSSNDNKDRGTLLHYYTGSTATDAFMGWDNSNGEFAFGSNVSVTGEIVTFSSLGNVRANFFIGDGSQLTGVVGTYGNGNVANYLPTFAGNLSAGNANLGNAATANFFVGSGAFLTSVTAVTAATVTTNSQPNITSVGTLTTLTIGNATANSTFGNGTITASGNISFTGANVSLGDASNLKITGGTSGYFLSTDGAGNLSWGAASGGGGVSATGSNTQIQFNDAGGLGTSVNLTFDKATNTFATARVVASNGANLGSNVANVYIGGGSNNQILTTDGTGNLSWVAQPVAIITVDNFTGDGSTTEFTLSSSPTNINQTSVNYNGTLQLRAAYTVSGSTLTFSEAPVSGSLLEVTTTMGAVSGAGAFVTRSYTGNGVQTNFSVTSGCTVSSVIVTENGLVQTPTVDYTISGGTLTFNGAPANGIIINIRELAIAVAATTATTTSITWNIASSNITMIANNGYFVDTLGGAKTMTLPSSATLGDTIRINDLAGSFGTNNLTVARNGHKIQGATDDLLIDVNQNSFGLVYSNSTYGWKVLEM